MKTPTAPNLARYFAKCGLTLHASLDFDLDGKRNTWWSLAQAANGKPYRLGVHMSFHSTEDLWSAWKAYQPNLHLQHAQALRFVRHFLQHEKEHFEPFNSWLDHSAVIKAAQAEDVDTKCWPWTSAQTSLDRRDRLLVYGHPWTDTPTIAVIERCTKHAESKGWARRAIRLARFDQQSATRYTEAIRDLVQDERRRRLEQNIRRAKVRRATLPRKRI